MKHIIELTRVQGFAPKTILRHIADVVNEDGGWLFWQANGSMADQLGTDRKTIRRNIAALREAGLIRHIADKKLPTGRVAVYRIDLDSLLALPGTQTPDPRPELVAELGVGGRGREPRGEGLRAPGVGVESPINLIERKGTKGSLRKRENLRVVHSAKDDPDHLKNDPEFAAWVEAQAREAQQ